MRRTLAIIFLSLAATVLAGQEMTVSEFADFARNEVEGRIRKVLSDDVDEATVSGIVTCSQEDHFYLQEKVDGIKVFRLKGALPEVGDRVTVKGSPSLEGGRVVFVAASWEKKGEAALPKPRKAVRTDLIDASTGARGVNWLRVEITGRAIGLTDTGFALDVDGLPVNVFTPVLPDFLSDCGTTHPKLRITGVAELLLDQSSLFKDDRYVMGVKVSASSAADIVLTPDAVYLMNRRDRRMTLVAVALLALLAIGLLAFAVVIFRQRRRLLMSRTVMAERKRMADDLHDTIEQHLAGVGMLLQLNRTKEARDILQRAKREMRDIVWGLKNDDMMRLTPTQMIQQLAKDETRKGLYRVESKLEGLPAQLDPSKMRDLSLIVREAIANAVKHGQARKIAISADPLDGGGWMLRIANDGAPFAAESAPGVKEGHFGLEGMRQRARRIGADLSISAKGDWTVVTLIAQH